ncbi:uncharacterized protein [Pagrus major]|uniref:uncharacterized protein n=1 Tax=Pagrus major TaxID=143350 RepID=UPI003CC84AF6
MQVVGLVEGTSCPCDQLVLMTCEDREIYAYDGEELHVVASSLKQLCDKGIEYPASKSYYKGEAFKDMTKKDWDKVRSSPAGKRLDTEHHDLILHSIFFLGEINKPRYIPKEIVSDDEMLNALRDHYPGPFKCYSSQLPKRSPFSCVLDMKNTAEDSVRYYGVSMSTSGRNPGRIIVAVCCLSTWDSHVADAVMTYYPSKKRKKPYFDGTIRLPEQENSPECPPQVAARTAWEKIGTRIAERTSYDAETWLTKVNIGLMVTADHDLEDDKYCSSAMACYKSTPKMDGGPSDRKRAKMSDGPVILPGQQFVLYLFLQCNGKTGPDYLTSVSDLVSKFKGETSVLKNPAGATLKLAGLDDTIYKNKDKVVNGWGKFYLPEVVSMQVVGVVEGTSCPCDQLILMTCEDEKIYAYDGEELHVVASSLKQLCDKGIEYPASKTYYKGEAFKDMTEKEWGKVRSSPVGKRLDTEHHDLVMAHKSKFLENLHFIDSARGQHSRSGWSVTPGHKGECINSPASFGAPCHSPTETGTFT